MPNLSNHFIKVSKIENGDIFTRDFRPLIKNNEITFSETERMAVIYGPNGAGKSSLAKVFSGIKGTKLEFEYNGQKHSSGSEVFHVINDQNNRNIIAGAAKDFLLGDNIKAEFELQDYISREFRSLLDKAIAMLKTNHGISAAKSPLIDLVTSQNLLELIRDLANNKSKGNKYSVSDFLKILHGITISADDIPEYEQVKLDFLKSDMSDVTSVISQIDAITTSELSANPKVSEIEENTEAIKILEHFHKDQCIVCDTEGIDRIHLLEQKSANRIAVIKALDEKLKAMIEKIIAFTSDNDPFGIKEQLLEAINKGDVSIILSLQSDFSNYKNIFNQLIQTDFVNLLLGSQLAEKNNEYEQILEQKPEITDEDALYIEEIISTSMNKTLKLERDEKKNLRIFLNNQEFLEKPRDELPLSTGEQNFLSLTFEFLKARNSVCPIVVLDDPISSFDSIYKNKVVYAIVKMLHSKQRIVLTHNIDMLRLLESQYRKSYKLYLLNNVENEENGFVSLNNLEQEMIINLEKLLSTFRTSIFSHIHNSELFLISMIPFMRGYANIISNDTASEQLTQLMHGYKTDRVDIAKIYIELFGNNSAGKIPSTYEISVPDILSKTVDGVHILDPAQYPLLDKTLKHSFVYLRLRLSVEKALVSKFNIDTNQYNQLGQIIAQAFPSETDTNDIRNRIRLTSKKTLINEFNHFEGNLSIFQPAIDITDRALGAERTDIDTFVSNL
jgi:ABC-type Mn2+/Zn2+ transport system ATPase subunit